MTPPPANHSQDVNKYRGETPGGYIDEVPASSSSGSPLVLPLVPLVVPLLVLPVVPKLVPLLVGFTWTSGWEPLMN